MIKYGTKKKQYFGWLMIAVLVVFTLAACTPAEAVYDEDGQLIPTTVVPPTATEEPEAPAEAENDENGLIIPEFPTAEPVSWEGAITTESGLQYLEIVTGEGATPQEGDLVVMDYIVTLTDGTELGNSTVMGEPISAVIGREQILEGWEEGVTLMKVGGKTRMLLPPELAFGEEGYGVIPPNSQLIVEVDLLEIREVPQPTEVAESDLTTSDSGLQYYDIVEGDGIEAVEGSTVSTHYAIWVQGADEDLYIVESTDGQPAVFTAGAGDVVFPGWGEGVIGMQNGGKRLLIIPSDLALGETGGGDIPPNATLIMEIELVEVIEPVVMTEVDEADFTETETGLKYYDFVVGDGASPESGQIAVVHYTGWLEDGTKFDSSLDHGQPFSFPIGTGSVIPGWDEGVMSMKVGGKRQLVVPADLGYGEAGAGGLIPPGATLIFEVELIEILEE